MLLASLATSIYTVRTQHVCFGSMRLEAGEFPL